MPLRLYKIEASENNKPKKKKKKKEEKKKKKKKINKELSENKNITNRENLIG